PARYTPHCRRTFHQTSSLEGEYPFHSISELVFSSHPTLTGGSFFYSIVCLRLSKTNDSIDSTSEPTSSCFRQTKRESTPNGLNPQRIRISLEHSFSQSPNGEHSLLLQSVPIGTNPFAVLTAIVAPAILTNANRCFGGRWARHRLLTHGA